MSSTSEQERTETLASSKKDFILWEGGVKFGGFMALTMGGVELLTHPQALLPVHFDLRF